MENIVNYLSHVVFKMVDLKKENLPSIKIVLNVVVNFSYHYEIFKVRNAENLVGYMYLSLNDYFKISLCICYT